MENKGRSTDITKLSPRRQKYIEEEIGKTYGRLTIESFAYYVPYFSKSTYPQYNLYFNCLCDCGNRVVARISNVKDGHVRSCGCLIRGEDICGQVFGAWTVLERDTSRRDRVFYHCRCICGNERSVEKKRLVHGKSKSCGCQRGLVRLQTIYKNDSCIANDLTGQRFGWLTVIERDFTKKRENGSKNYVYWKCQCRCGNVKSIMAINLVKGKTVSCGCYLQEIQKIHGEAGNEITGVIDGTNLYSIQNAMDGKVSRANKTGVRGVSLQKGGYVAKIAFKGKEYYLGTYKSLDEAANVRKRANQVLYGEWLEYYESNLKKEHEDECNRILQELSDRIMLLRRNGEE